MNSGRVNPKEELKEGTRVLTWNSHSKKFSDEGIIMKARMTSSGLSYLVNIDGYPRTRSRKHIRLDTSEQPGNGSADYNTEESGGPSIAQQVETRSRRVRFRSAQQEDTGAADDTSDRPGRRHGGSDHGLRREAERRGYPREDGGRGQ